MIYILHGEDTFESRKKLNELLLNAEKIIRIDLKKNPINIALQAFEDTDLFIVKKTIVFEGSLKGMDVLIEQINKEKESKTNTVIIWSQNLLDAKILPQIKNPTVFTFNLPKPIFAFLDSLSPKNGNLALQKLSEAAETSEDELVFYSVVKRIRLLILLKTRDYDKFSDIKYLKPWQLGKLQKQAGDWNLDSLKNFYSKLFDLEVLLKTSSLPLGLAKHLDIMLFSELN